MRIDKYLKVARILKKRSVSKELALNDRIEVNGRVVKPSYNVKVGDVVKVTYGRRQMSVKVLQTPENAKKSEASDLYSVIDESYVTEQ